LSKISYEYNIYISYAVANAIFPELPTATALLASFTTALIFVVPKDDALCVQAEPLKDVAIVPELPQAT
jgi:hypothetical protein